MTELPLDYHESVEHEKQRKAKEAAVNSRAAMDLAYRLQYIKADLSVIPTEALVDVMVYVLTSRADLTSEQRDKITRAACNI